MKSPTFKKVLKWTGIGLVSLIGLVVIAAAAIHTTAGMRLNRIYDINPKPLYTTIDAADLERGRHLVEALAVCVNCHGDDLGGKVYIDDPSLGRVVATNITKGKGSSVADYTNEDWVRAIRHGVGKDGRPLFLMPAQLYYYLGDSDLAAIIAYVKSVPAVDNSPPPSEYRLFARFLILIGDLPYLRAEQIAHNAPPPPAPDTGVTVGYGQYLSVIGGCGDCHGPGFSGGHMPGTPPDWPDATNITPAGIGSWTEENFFRAMREGLRPSGIALDPFMPWLYTTNMTDDEIRALWLYIKTVPPKPSGNP